tara:strand:+ start:2372 stop:4711 length:2340 start_codon:yes stop_codon:yes gene_type:complete
MKNNIFYIFVLSFVFLNLNLVAQELEINSNKIQYDDVNKITIFEGNVNSKDKKGNKIYSEYAVYNKKNELIETTGETKIITSNGSEVLSSNVIFDNKKKLILSNYKTQIKDSDGNRILVDTFSYSISTSIFFSRGNVEIFDINNNNYKFSEIYIDENKKKIIGSDVKAFLKPNNITNNPDSEPRFFANTMSLNKNTNTLNKGIFTSCKNKKGDKCPPWVLQSEKITHDLAKKTIYYDNVVLKIYDFPIFFSPKFSHPDPTVKRRSGVLIPSFSSNSTVGNALSIPYFLDLGGDRDLTLTPKLYLTENPLILSEYRQDFKDSFLVVDTGYSRGFKKQNSKKTKGSRSHFFSKFNMNLLNNEEENSNLEVNLQKVSNSTYLKVHDVQTALVEKDKNILENSIDFSYQYKDFFLGVVPGAYEDINKSGNLKHEYLLPLSIEKNIITNAKYGVVDLNTNLKIKNYDTNKQANFFVNDFNWKSNKWLNKLGFENHFEGKIKNVNYDAENTNKFKNDETNSEFHGVLGYFTKLGLYKKNIINKDFFTLTPKFLLRYAPGHMRRVEKGRLKYVDLYNLNKIKQLDVIESGLSSSVGFEFKKNKLDKKNNVADEVFSFSAGQVISDVENMDIPSSTSLDQKFSDIVGEAKYNLNGKVNLNYNFSIDQGYKNFNYNEFGSDFNFTNGKFNLSYLQEKNHIGNQEFFQTGVDYKLNNSNELSFSTKRNLLTSSAEFYNLSYNYINDCLKAGLAYRREFYTDRDIEPANTLMFTISIIPFAEINSPSFTK